MTIARSENMNSSSDDKHWLRAIASLSVGAGFFALWFSLLPQWLGFDVRLAGAAGWRWLASVPSVIGFAVALRCVWDFGWTGHGTPAPMAPPQRLVVVGFYCYVRNPMYVGFAAGWVGLWTVFGHPDPRAIAVAIAVALGIHLFVLLYEEPTLRRRFGADYERYCRNVRRWWPRVKPWSERRFHDDVGSQVRVKLVCQKPTGSEKRSRTMQAEDGSGGRSAYSETAAEG